MFFRKCWGLQIDDFMTGTQFLCKLHFEPFKCVLQPQIEKQNQILKIPMQRKYTQYYVLTL